MVDELVNISLVYLLYDNMFYNNVVLYTTLELLQFTFSNTQVQLSVVSMPLN